MVGDKIWLVHQLNFVTDNGFLIFENSDCTVNFNPFTLFILEILKLLRDLGLTFLIEDDRLGASCVLDFINSPHVLIMSFYEATNNNDVIAFATIDFTVIIWSDA